MTKEELKKISSEVSNDCLKKLKIIAIEKEISLSQHVRNILEKSVASKKFSNEEVNS